MMDQAKRVAFLQSIAQALVEYEGDPILDVDTARVVDNTVFVTNYDGMQVILKVEEIA